MTDRVYPSAATATINPKPPTATTTTTTSNHQQQQQQHQQQHQQQAHLSNGCSSTFAPPKSHLYNPIRHPYRPSTATPKPRHRRRRSCCHRCCLFCIWLTIFLLGLILLSAIAGGVLWVLYRPQRPSFSVTSLSLTSFNLTTSPSDQTSSINSKLSLLVSAKNPNKKLVFFYDPIAVFASSDSASDFANSTLPSFAHPTKNTTTLRATLSTDGPRSIDSDAANSIRSTLRKTKNRLPIQIRIETAIKLKLGSLKTNKFPIRVFCDGIQVSLPKKNSTSVTPFVSSSSNPNCKVKLRFKIWKFQF